MNVEEAREVLRREEEKLANPEITSQRVPTVFDHEEGRGGIKVRLMVGPVSIDTEAEPEQIIVLVKRMVQEFTSAGIIPKV